MESDGYTLINRSKHEESCEVFDMSPIKAKQLLKIDPRTKFENKALRKSKHMQESPVICVQLARRTAKFMYRYNHCTSFGS